MGTALVRTQVTLKFVTGFIFIAASCLQTQSQPQGNVPISHEERQALVTLYKATDGDHWKNHTGWLGAPGTECEWYGIRCDYDHVGLARVSEVVLFENNLIGTVPEELGQLANLTSLMIFGNHLSGRIPLQFIQQWLAGSLDIGAEASLMTDVSEIDYESSATSILCNYHHRFVLGADGSVVHYAKRCRNTTPHDRRTFCEVKEGHIQHGDFARLGWLIEKNGFYGLQPDYSRSVTDVGLESTRVVRNGKSYEVTNYATPGPQELWVIQSAVQGIALSAEWEKTTTRTKCPRWSDSKNSGLE